MIKVVMLIVAFSFSCFFWGILSSIADFSTGAFLPAIYHVVMAIAFMTFAFGTMIVVKLGQY